jgi:hypothetical protein
MTLEEISFVAGIITGIGVIISLIFVGLQLREQNRESRLAAIRQISLDLQRIADSMRDDPQMIEIWLQSLTEGMESLDQVSGQRVTFFFTTLVRIWQDAFFQQRDGRLDEHTWISVERSWRSLAATKSFRQYWTHRSNTYSDEFVNYLNGLEPAEPVRTIKDLVEEDEQRTS